MTSILDQLNSGSLHAAARTAKPDCVDALGNVHRTPERRAFVDWRRKMVALYGDDAMGWPQCAKDELKKRHVSA